MNKVVGNGVNGQATRCAGTENTLLDSAGLAESILAVLAFREFAFRAISTSLHPTIITVVPQLFFRKAVRTECLSTHVTKCMILVACATYGSLFARVNVTAISTVAVETVEAKLIVAFDAVLSAYIRHSPALGLAGIAIEILISHLRLRETSVKVGPKNCRHPPSRSIRRKTHYHFHPALPIPNNTLWVVRLANKPLKYQV